jgi:signal peptidase I
MPGPIGQKGKFVAKSKDKGGVFDTVRTVVYAILIAVGIRTVAYEPFNIPSESMLPTLLVGDYLFVSKFSLGYSHHSLPFSLPLFSGRIFERPPKRGDVVVFKLPRDNKTDFIKRVVGLPGDRVQLIDGVLHINEKAIPRERINDFVVQNAGGNVHRVPQYLETMPNGVSYRTLDLIENGGNDNTRVFTVREGHYFMMGDNRDNSLDSRFASGVGQVPAENLVGRAEFLFFSTDGSARFWQAWAWPSSTRFSRMFRGISGL